jgi:hypothetical protein
MNYFLLFIFCFSGAIAMIEEEASPLLTSSLVGIINNREIRCENCEEKKKSYYEKRKHHQFCEEHHYFYPENALVLEATKRCGNRKKASNDDVYHSIMMGYFSSSSSNLELFSYGVCDSGPSKCFKCGFKKFFKEGLPKFFKKIPLIRGFAKTIIANKDLNENLEKDSFDEIDENEFHKKEQEGIEEIKRDLLEYGPKIIGKIIDIIK